MLLPFLSQMVAALQKIDPNSGGKRQNPNQNLMPMLVSNDRSNNKVSQKSEVHRGVGKEGSGTKENSDRTCTTTDEKNSK